VFADQTHETAIGLGGAAVVTIYRRPVFSGSAAAAQPVANKSRAESVGAPSAAPAVTAAAAPASAPAAPSAAQNLPSGFAAEQVFGALAKQASPELVAKVKAVFRFDISKGDQKRSWLLDLKNGKGSISNADDSTPKADCTIAISDEDFVQLMAG